MANEKAAPAGSISSEAIMDAVISFLAVFMPITLVRRMLSLVLIARQQHLLFLPCVILCR